MRGKISEEEGSEESAVYGYGGGVGDGKCKEVERTEKCDWVVIKRDMRKCVIWFRTQVDWTVGDVDRGPTASGQL